MKIRMAIISACAVTFSLLQTNLAQAANVPGGIGMTSGGGNKGFGKTFNPKGGKPGKRSKTNNTTTRSNTQHN